MTTAASSSEHWLAQAEICAWVGHVVDGSSPGVKQDEPLKWGYSCASIARW